MDDMDGIELELFNERGDLIAEAETMARSVRQDICWLVDRCAAASPIERLAVSAAALLVAQELERLSDAIAAARDAA